MTHSQNTHEVQTLTEGNCTHGMPMWEAITVVLQKYGNEQAMRILDVCKIAICEGLLQLKSQTPENSIRAMLSIENKQQCPRLFSRCGLVALTESALEVAIRERFSQMGITKVFQKNISNSANTDDMCLFRSILLSDFPRGISFSSASESLLRNTAGKAMSKEVKQALQAQMFQRGDNTWLLPEMVLDNDILELLVRRANVYLKCSCCFSLATIREQFRPLLQNLPDIETDFKCFFMQVIKPKLDYTVLVSGGKSFQLCHESGKMKTEVFEHLTLQIYDVLMNAGDAVSVDFLSDQLPFLCVNIINSVIQQNIPNAITLTLDGRKYWKLLKFFYLPEDINKRVTDIVDLLKAEGYSPSAMLIASELDHVYEGNFCENFAVSDRSVFQQIISLTYQGKEARVWKNCVFRHKSDEVQNNVLDDFLKTQTGFFHESKFFEYAEQTRGLTNKGMLVLTFLRMKCIRLDRDQWVSTGLFSDRATLLAEDMECIANRLTELLGNQAFLPIGTLPNSFFESLPTFLLDGKTRPWNAYLLSSLCRHCIPSLQLVNDEPSPYTVTAMLIPDGANLNGDVVDYVLNEYQASGLAGKTAIDIFEYLKQQQVRMTKSKKLMARIRAKCGVM